MSRSDILAICALVGFALWRPVSAGAEVVDYFTDNGYGNPIATMQHPCAEFFDGVTYIAYQGPHEDPYVCAYDHASKKWSGPVKAGVSLMGHPQDAVTKDGQIDNHGRPALIVDAEGFIHLIFGGHGGSYSFGENKLGAPGGGKQTHVVSKRPRDITEWEELENVSPFGTYSQWVKMANGDPASADLYLFYRHGSHQSDWVYHKSTDNGRTFAPEVSVLKSKPSKADPDTFDAWYAWFANGKPGEITASYVYHPCNKIGQHTKDRFNCYYMAMNARDGSWRNASGEKLATPVTLELADKRTLIVSTGDERANHGTCRVDENGDPHVFFRQGKGGVVYYRWLGDKWQAPSDVIPGASGQDGDMIVESPTNVRMLLRYKADGQNSVGYWATTDGGLTWKKEPPLIASRRAAYNPISAIVRNARPEARILLSEDVNGQQHQYHHMILLGDNGPVGRPIEETRNLGDRLTRPRAPMPTSKSKGKGKGKGMR